MRRQLLILAVCLVMATGITWATDPGKGVEESRTGGPIRTIGGPDGFGYNFIDNGESNGFQPTYTPLDISASGTAMGLSDDGEGDAVIAFAFPFYGVSYTDARIGNNGGILLGTPGTGDVWAGNTCPMPYTGHAYPAIFAFWDDLDTETGDVYYQSFAGGACPQPDCGAGACFVVQWYQRPHFNGVGDATLEAILCDSGDIIFQYEDLDFGDPTVDWGASATVGIEDDAQDPTFFLEYSCNSSADLDNGIAVKFTTGPVPVQLQSFSAE